MAILQVVMQAHILSQLRDLGSIYFSLGAFFENFFSTDLASQKDEKEKERREYATMLAETAEKKSGKSFTPAEKEAFIQEKIAEEIKNIQDKNKEMEKLKGKEQAEFKAKLEILYANDYKIKPDSSFSISNPIRKTIEEIDQRIKNRNNFTKTLAGVSFTAGAVGGTTAALIGGNKIAIKFFDGSIASDIMDLKAKKISTLIQADVSVLLAIAAIAAVAAGVFAVATLTSILTIHPKKPNKDNADVVEMIKNQLKGK